MKRQTDPDVLLLQAAADPTRLAILRQLSDAPEVCACDFTACCDVSQPTVSHHLKVLRDAGWIDGRTARNLGLVLASPRGGRPLPRAGRRVRDAGRRAVARVEAAPGGAAARADGLTFERLEGLRSAKQLLLDAKPNIETINSTYIERRRAARSTSAWAGTATSGARSSRCKPRRTARSSTSCPRTRPSTGSTTGSSRPTAEHPVAAHKWINYVLDPEIAGKEMNYHQYAVPVTGITGRRPEARRRTRSSTFRTTRSRSTRRSCRRPKSVAAARPRLHGVQGRLTMAVGRRPPRGSAGAALAAPGRAGRGASACFGRSRWLAVVFTQFGTLGLGLCAGGRAADRLAAAVRARRRGDRRAAPRPRQRGHTLPAAARAPVAGVLRGVLPDPARLPAACSRSPRRSASARSPTAST